MLQNKVPINAIRTLEGLGRGSFHEGFCSVTFQNISESFGKFRGHLMKNIMSTYCLALKILQEIFNVISNINIC